jgi:cytochrome b561
MRVLTIVMAWVTMLLLIFELICGLWIKSHGADASAAGFHMTLGILAVVSGITTSVLALVQAGRKKREKAA